MVPDGGNGFEHPDTGADVTLDPSALIPTGHDRVFYADESDEFHRGEHALAAFLADHLPNWNVVVTMGAFRLEYSVAYEVYPSENFVHVDCYSAGFAQYGDGSIREEHPAVAHAESLLHEIAEAIKGEGGFDAEDLRGEI